jgi:hypothetical protein
MEFAAGSFSMAKLPSSGLWGSILVHEKRKRTAITMEKHITARPSIIPPLSAEETAELSCTWFLVFEAKWR